MPDMRDILLIGATVTTVANVRVTALSLWERSHIMTRIRYLDVKHWALHRQWDKCMFVETLDLSRPS
jgi:hypothetical protein